MLVSWIKSKALTITVSVAFCALIWGGLASWGYVSSQKELSSLKEQNRQLQEDYSALSLDRDKILSNAAKTDKVVSKLQEDLNTIEQQKDNALSKLDKFRCPKINTQSVEKQSNEEVDVTMPFSPEFRDAIRLPAPRS